MASGPHTFGEIMDLNRRINGLMLETAIPACISHLINALI